MMLVANSFDLWQKDAFFSAAEEVQQSADIMESMYRLWVRGTRQGQQVEYSYELRRELQIALATAKWQLEEFDKAVRFSHGYRSQDNTTARHKQFVDIMDKQISRVEKELRESLAEEKQSLSWVHLDEEESDDLEAFLSGTSATSQSTDDEDSSFSGDHMRGKDANLEKQVMSINRDTKYVVELEAKQVGDQVRIGSWKIVIADEDDHKNTFTESSSSKGKHKGWWEHLHTKGRLSTNRFTKLCRRARSIQFSKFLLVVIILLLMLTIFLIA